MIFKTSFLVFVLMGCSDVLGQQLCNNPAIDRFFQIESCSKNFGVCLGLQKFELTCPGESIFAREICRSPSNAPECAKFECPDGGFFPDPAALCTENFINCIGGEPYPDTCPPGSIFDPVSRLCAPPQSVNCAASDPAFKCPGAGFFADPDELCSTSYFSCIAGNPYPQTCRAGIFDPSLGYCTLPATSPSCGGSRIRK